MVHHPRGLVTGHDRAAGSLSVIICCYTRRRRHQLAAAISETLTQLNAFDELIVVVDHNPELLHDLSTSYPEVAVCANTGGRGLSEARNTGMRAASGEVVVFLDDDAVPERGALDALRDRFRDATVVAVGGAVTARWDSRAPAWFPDEFGWVVGCDYRGLPVSGAAIRNPIGAAMGVRRDALVAVGGFSAQLGRQGTLPVGCEETLMGIALREQQPDSIVVRDSAFRVLHAVPDDRATLRYFVRRCYHEGRSKALLSQLAGTGNALASERRYTLRVLPAGLWRHRYSPRRLGALVLGLVVTCAGYASGSISRRVAG